MISFGIRSYFKNRLSKVNKDAIWVFGNPKSGTTAIAALLARHSGKSVTLDTNYLWEPFFSMLISGKISFIEHINKYSYPFSKEIIKEPSATLLFDDIRKCFYLKSYVFIVRNPFDNIKSILNRLNIAGNKKELNLEKIPKLWQGYFAKLNGKQYIETLALKWVEANSNLEIIENGNCQLVKYEDFKLDKERYIANLAQKLNLSQKNTINNIKDNQFQPKGKNQDNRAFFGEENYKIIANICGKQMAYFGYTLEREH